MTGTVGNAVVLLSGGLDSTTTAALARSLGYTVFALTIRYGQRHTVELDAANRVAMALGVATHHVLSVDLRQFGGSALTGDDAVPKDVPLDQSGIPITYVPARNMIFLGLATAWAEIIGARDIFIGVSAVDAGGYPDCRREFIDAFEVVANLGTRASLEGGRPFRIHTPLIDRAKFEIVQLGVQLGVDYGLTHSCYDPLPDGTSCAHCLACQLRLRGFRECGLVDPIRYIESSDTP